MSNTSNSSNNQSKDRVASKVRPSRIKPDFKLDSYSIDNPPPLISRQHSRKEFRVAHSDTLSMLIGLSSMLRSMVSFPMSAIPATATNHLHGLLQRDEFSSSSLLFEAHHNVLPSLNCLWLCTLKFV
ncbi:hypothetical protein ABKN59_007145 [Abortiporus biennis]